MASNLIVMASNLTAMASNLIVRASNLVVCCFLSLIERSWCLHLVQTMIWCLPPPGEMCPLRFIFVLLAALGHIRSVRLATRPVDVLNPEGSTVKPFCMLTGVEFFCMLTIRSDRGLMKYVSPMASEQKEGRSRRPTNARRHYPSRQESKALCSPP